MKKTFVLLLLMHSSIIIIAQYQTSKSTKGDNYFLNPIFAGDYPDPGILRDGNDYYVVYSSFDLYPDLLIWHSKDLINWEPVTHALYKHVGQFRRPNWLNTRISITFISLHGDQISLVPIMLLLPVQSQVHGATL